MKLEDLPPDPDDWCAWCGAALPLDFLYGTRRFCSRACSQAHHAELARRAEKAARACDHCGGPIPAELRLGTRFCSRTCHKDWWIREGGRQLRQERAGRPCRECGGPIPAELRVNAVYCSDDCHKRVRARRMRERRAS